MAKAAAPSERKDDFNKDEVLQKAMLFSLVQIYKEKKNLSDSIKLCQ